MKRRSFLEKFALTSAGLMITRPSLAYITGSSEKKHKLVILHTNDTHSNIDPFPKNHSKYPGMGGIAKRYAMVKAIREKEPNVLLLDSGDIFQGTPYFNTFHGVLEMKCMSRLGYDASTMGNHDFDIGMDGFIKAKKHANFPFLCANYDFSNTVLKGATQAFKIFKKGSVKIGVFGIGIELNGLVPSSAYGDTVCNDPIEIANETAAQLKKEKCDLVICLSHLGFEYQDDQKVSDRKLAQNSKNIDIILGGHTHTFLEEPVIEKNKSKKNVLINQVGWAGIQLGRIDIDIKKVKLSSENLVIF
jgi:5'-nucleotidase